MTEHEAAVDVHEIARIIGVSATTVYGMAQRGELPYFKVGNRWRFFPTKVIAHLEREQEQRDPWAQPPGSAAAHRGWASRHAREAEARRKRPD
jgi:excisionase family DNA binding protein